MSGNGSLSLEMKQKIEENRRKAEEKKKLKKQKEKIEEKKKQAEQLRRDKEAQTLKVTNNNSHPRSPVKGSFPRTTAQLKPSVAGNTVKLKPSADGATALLKPPTAKTPAPTKPSAAGNTAPPKPSAPGPPKLAKAPPINASIPSASIYMTNINVTAWSKPSEQPAVEPLRSDPPPVPETFKPVGIIGSATAKCELISPTKFEVRMEGYSDALINLFKTVESRHYDTSSRRWSFHLKDYHSLVQKIKMMGRSIKVEELPWCVLRTFNDQVEGNDYVATKFKDADLSIIDPNLESTLLPFQREGINFAIGKNGRILIADDMGLGKTLQALAIASYYKYEWPLLIVVPSSVRFSWREQIYKWIPSLNPQHVNVVVTGTDNCTSGKINIISYDLMARKKAVLTEKAHKVIIMDESHLLKNFKTVRYKAAQPLLQKARRVILLSGTPAMSKPLELYTQMYVVNKTLFPSFYDFGRRYCDGKQNAFGWDFNGSSNLRELQILLKNQIMIRRLKSDVLTQLPSKTREMVILAPHLIKQNKSMKKSDDKIGNTKGVDRHNAILEYFFETAKSKNAAVKEYVSQKLEAGLKFLVFGHHKEMLDGIEKAVVKQKVKYIRIDGSTPSELRATHVENFQTNDEIRIAILSITSANAGLNLTAASLVVFAELFWNPGILIQAEDRVHRIGQENAVNIHYLIAKKTADDYIWPLVQKKLEILGQAGLAKETFKDAQTKRFTDPKQKSVMSLFEQSFMEETDEDLVAASRPQSQRTPPRFKSPEDKRAHEVLLSPPGSSQKSPSHNQSKSSSHDRHKSPSHKQSKSPSANQNTSPTKRRDASPSGSPTNSPIKQIPGQSKMLQYFSASPANKTDANQSMTEELFPDDSLLDNYGVWDTVLPEEPPKKKKKKKKNKE